MPRWSQLVADVLVAVLILVLFCTYGASTALTAVAIQREHRWSERVGLFLGVLGGIALAALGIIGVCGFLRSIIHEL